MRAAEIAFPPTEAVAFGWFRYQGYVAPWQALSSDHGLSIVARQRPTGRLDGDEATRSRAGFDADGIEPSGCGEIGGYGAVIGHCHGNGAVLGVNYSVDFAGPFLELKSLRGHGSQRNRRIGGKAVDRARWVCCDLAAALGITDDRQYLLASGTGPRRGCQQRSSDHGNGNEPEQSTPIDASHLRLRP